MEAKYTLDQWRRERREFWKGLRKFLSEHPDDYKTFGHQGSPTLPCPWCGKIGFFNARKPDGKRHYRMCKWCGKMQNVGEEVKQCSFVFCNNHHEPWGGWTIEPKGKICSECGTKMKIIKGPMKNKKHFYVGGN